MKKLLVLVLSVVMIMSFVACKKTDDAAEGAYKAGTYSGEAQGHNGMVKVEVELDAQSIKAVKVLENEETVGVADPAIEKIPQSIVEHQSLAVDTVSGATVTSKAIIEATTSALTSAGVDTTKLMTKVEKKTSGEEVTKECDVVVAGGGIAGLAAALEATNNGAKVILLEKMPAVGGSTTRSGGKILAAGSTIQKAAGIEDNPADFAKFLMDIGENKVDKDFIELIANNSAANIQWLQDNGVEFADKIEPLHSYRKPARGHYTSVGSGAGFIKPLEAKLLEKGGEILLETPATELIQEDGRVVGIKATNGQGDNITVKAKAVIIATGGFTRNPEMIAEYYPSAGDFKTGTGDGNTGDGIKMGIAVGADIIMPDGGINIAVNPATKNGYGEGATGLFVTPKGERFMDEKDFHFKRTRILMDLGFNSCWYIYDESGYNDLVQKALDGGTAYEADSIEALAEKMKADPAILKATVEEYNKMAEAGKDTKFNKAAEFMKPIKGSKFYAENFLASNSGTHGGLKINIDGQVLDKEGKIIPGLYAAGEVASGQILYREYPGSGTAIMCFLTFGRQAGAAATK